jgi:hypothetical protein
MTETQGIGYISETTQIGDFIARELHVEDFLNA